MQSVILRKYGEEATVDFSLFGIDGINFKVDAASATGDITINRDEAGVETLDADAFVDEGTGYSLVLSAAEMAAKRIHVHIVDQGTKVWLDTGFVVETYGNASAMHIFDLDVAMQDVNVIQVSGDATAADNLELMYDGTGYAGGTIVLQSDMTKIHGTAITETATQLAGAFTKFFDVATPTGTVNSIPDAVAGAAGGLFIAGTNAATAITTAFTTNIIGDITGALSGAVGSVTGAVGSVGAGGIVAATLGADCITSAKIADNAIAAEHIAAAAIDNATFAADVGSTAYATNVIALAVNKAVANYDGPTNTEMVSAFTEIKGSTWSSVTDTLEDIRNAAQGGGGGGGSTATITIKDTDTSGDLLASVNVYVYDATNTTSLGYGLTNGSGVATINLPGDATYKVRLYKAGWDQSTDPETLTLSGDTADEYYMTEFSATAASGSTTTTLYGTIRTASGANYENVTVKAKLVNPVYFDGADVAISNEEVSALTNSSGYFELTLVRSATYHLTIEALGVRNKVIEPTAATLDIEAALRG